MTPDDCDLLCLDLPHAELVRSALPDPQLAQERAEVAKALSDPTRLRIATALAVGEELCVCDLAWVCELAQNLVSHHARSLRQAGVATSRRDGKLVLYRLTEVGHAVLDAVIPELISAHAHATSTPSSRFVTKPAATKTPTRSRTRTRAVPAEERTPTRPRRATAAHGTPQSSGQS